MNHINLNPLRKNAKNASYIVVNSDVSGVTQKTTYYASIEEALKHCIENKNGDIITKGLNRLIAFYCGYSSKMKFGFGVNYHERHDINAIWWAEIA